MDSHYIRSKYTVIQKAGTAFLVLSVFLPTAFAQAQSFQGVAIAIINILEVFVVRILFLLATVVFIWGVIMYITAGGSEDKVKKGRGYILWGLTGLTVMVAIWGIVQVVTTTFFPGGIPPAPQLPDIPGA